MKRTLQRAATLCAALLLCLSALLALTTAQAGDASDNPIDFGLPDMKTNQALSASELFDALFDAALTPNEIAYLDGLSGVSLIYNDAIPDSIVSTEYNGESGTLRLSLPPYRFTASNGTTVEWVPTEATIGERSLPFVRDSGHYVCELDELFYSGDFEIRIGFSWSATVPATSVDRLLTLTYAEAERALGEITEYERTLADYNVARTKYLAHQAYLEAAEAFRVYSEIDKPAFDAAYAEYLVLRAQYDQYLNRLAAFEAWEQYWAYQAFMSDDVQTRYLAYQQYLSKLEPIKQRIGVLEALFVIDSHDWMLYRSLMGNTVATVVENKKELVLAGCSEADVNQAGDSTTKLRALMEQYNALRGAKYETEHARLTALYAFYTQNYRELTRQFDRLYSALKRLSDNAAVITEMSRRGKLDHFRQFIGQLYYTQAVLDDTETFNASTVVAGVVVTTAVEPCQRLTDRGSADPAGVLMPETEVPRVEKVEQIERPSFDEVHHKPTLAEFGLSEIPTEPQEPTKVDPPIYVAPAPDPGEAPSAPALDAKLRAVAEDLRQGKLPRREALGRDLTLSFAQSITCAISISNRKTISFYSADGKTLLDRQTLEYGTHFSYQGLTDVQNRPSDERSHYQFLGWVLPDGSVPSELCATANLSLYANYRETPRFYDVTWILDGKTELQRLPYGALPTSPFPTVKEDDAAASYAFSGWDKPIEPVGANVTYTASFLATPRTYTVTWIAGEVTQTQILPYGSMPAFDGIPSKAPDGSVYKFVRWDREVDSVRADVTYTAIFQKTLLASNEYGEALHATHSDTCVTVLATTKRADVREAAIYALSLGKSLEVGWNGFSLTLSPEQLPALISSRAREIGILEQSSLGGSTVYRVGYLNSAGAPEELLLDATLEILTNEAGGQLVGYVERDGEWIRAESNVLSVTGAVHFRIADVHRITVSANEPINPKNLPRFAESGSEIALSLIGYEFGYEIVSAVLVAPDGTRQALTQGSFVMPSEAVTLELTLKKIVYHVVFRVDGVVIARAQYGSGEEIVLPADPTKANDELYTYTFTGWSPDVPAIAYGDTREMVFDAIFSKLLTDPNSITPDRSIFYLFLGIASGALLLLIAGTVTLIVLLRRRKKAKHKKAAVNLPADTLPAHTASAEGEAVEDTENSEAAATSVAEAEPIAENGTVALPEEPQDGDTQD